MPTIPRNRLVPIIAATVVGLAILIGGGFWWTDKQTFEKTDNAFVQADTVQISPQVAGYVV
ncbi:MAG: HlyD family secretion protein, partial [Caulobacterales bacterium]|nr:HlyD family secretion protein [Caulobacterales bacterium]